MDGGQRQEGEAGSGTAAQERRGDSRARDRESFAGRGRKADRLSSAGRDWTGPRGRSPALSTVAVPEFWAMTRPMVVAAAISSSDDGSPCGSAPRKQSSVLTIIERVAAMIVDPPGEPVASRGVPSASEIIVGVIELRGLFPPMLVASVPSAVRLALFPPSGRLANGRPVAGSAAEAAKSVSSLLSKKPRPGTTAPQPQADSTVVVCG